MHIRVAQIQHYSHVLPSDISIQLNRQTFESDLIVVAEDNLWADGARHSQSVGAGASIGGVVVQSVEGPAKVIGTVNSKCFYWIAVSSILSF